MSDYMQQNTRRGEDEEAPTHRFKAVAESTFALMLARFGVPLLLAIIGFLIRGEVVDIKDEQREQGKAQIEQGRDIALVKSDVRDLGTLMGERVIRQVDNNTKDIANHEERLQRIERLVPTP